MIATPANTCAIYTRVSTEEQLEGHSIEAQERLVSDYARFRDWNIFRVYSDKGRSGTNIYRPEFQRMLADLQSGLFRVIVVHKIDRFSRNLVDGYTLIKQFNETGVALVSVTENLDMTTPMGKAFVGMLLIWSELYIDNLRTEISKGKRERVHKGFWNGTLSWGYTTPKRLQAMLVSLNALWKSREIPANEYEQRATLMDNALALAEDKHETGAVPDPFDAPGVQRAYDEYGTGLYSDRDISELLNGAGYRISARKGTHLLRKDTVEDILQNRFYIGETSYGRKIPGQKRQWMPGNHEPLIDIELFDHCQQVRKERAGRFSRGTVHTRQHPYLLETLTCLECGCRYIGQMHRGRRRYFDPATSKGITCSQHPRYVWADTVEEYLGNLLTQIHIPEDWKQRVAQTLAQGQPRVIRQSRGEVDAKLERLQRLYIMGELKEGQYLSLKEELQLELSAIPEAPGSLLNIQVLVDLLDNMPVLWGKMTADEKKRVFRLMFHKVYIREGDIAGIEPTGLLWTLLGVFRTGRTGIVSLFNTRFIPYPTDLTTAQQLLIA